MNILDAFSKNKMKKQLSIALTRGGTAGAFLPQAARLLLSSINPLEHRNASR